jgi:hypothetical protein
MTDTKRICSGWRLALEKKLEPVALNLLRRIYESRMTDDFSTHTSHRIDSVNFLQMSS